MIRRPGSSRFDDSLLASFLGIEQDVVIKRRGEATASGSETVTYAVGSFAVLADRPDQTGDWPAPAR